MNKIQAFSILFFSVFSLSQAGNLIRLCDTHAFTIVFYRLILAFFLFLPFCFPAIRKNLRIVDKRNLGKMILMGFIFAFHLFFWVKAVQKTQVANAAICYSILPVFISIGSYLVWKEAINQKIVLSILAGIIGIFLVGYEDFSASMDLLWGDILSMISALLFAVYFLIAKSVREKHDNLFIMNFVYFFGALTCFALIHLEGAPLSGFTTQTKVGFLLLAIVPTIFGHAVFIYISKYFPANVSSVFILLEPVFAGIVAYFAWQEKITVLIVLGYLFILAGLLFLIFSQNKEVPEKEIV